MGRRCLARAAAERERFSLLDTQGVTMSIKDYLDAIAPAPAWLKQSWATAKRSGVVKMSIRDIDAEIRRHRHEKEKKGRSR